MAQLKPGVGMEEIAAQFDRMADAILALNRELAKAQRHISELQDKVRRLEQ